MIRRRIPRVLAAAGSVAGMLVAVAALAPALVGADWVKERVQASLARRLGRPVTFERLALRYDPLPVVRVSRLQVGNPPGLDADLFLQVDEARLEFRLDALRRRSLKLGELVLERPRLVVAQRPAGDWSVPGASALRGAAVAPLALVSRMRLRDGRIDRSPGRSEDQAGAAVRARDPVRGEGSAVRGSFGLHGAGAGAGGS